ncbi:MAG: DNA repair protein RecO [Clostridiales Family XIII bacterium]|jgi:DNA repair protein RecO (recombination protein O)|nr:DNA repair protein RecO [Clostridiales Family XIII bacterium]
MTAEHTGIVIRQTKITGGRRMILVFTRDAGKISAGTRISERKGGGGALAIRPFAYGRYFVREGANGFFSITSAETIDAHFALGGDADRFAEASFALEFTDRLLPEGIPAQNIFDLLRRYLTLLCARESDFRLLTISYMVKVMQDTGVFPDAVSSADFPENELLSGVNDDIFTQIVFLAENPLERMAGLTFNREKEGAVFTILTEFARRHLDIGMLKSEKLLL